MLAIYKRELKSYFCNVTGCLFIAINLLFSGIYFTAYHLSYGYPYIAYTISRRDIKDLNIVLLKSDIFARYMSKECLDENNFYAKFKPIDSIINDHMGSDISNVLDNYIDNNYGIAI